MAAVLLSAGTAMPAAAAEPSPLPDHIVNGDFEYPTANLLSAEDHRFTYISLTDDSYWRNGDVENGRYHRPPLPAGFDKAKFAWHSTQTGGADVTYPDAEKRDDVQVWMQGDGTNHYSELAAAQQRTSIYQDIATTPGVAYRWSLRHANLNAAYADKMSVLIGTPGHETAQQATRVSVNGNGDQTGPVGTIISSKASNTDTNHTGQWETYTGVYVATGTVTRFTFENVDSASAYDGNLLDDISFQTAYPLTYDRNGGIGALPERKN